MLRPKFEWKDYFSGTPETTLNSLQYRSRQNPSVSSVYVSSCLFNECTVASGHGGALCCTSATYLFVESSSFFSCKTSSGNGGGIYFANTGSGQSVLYKICCNNCSSTACGSFARIDIQNLATNKNYVNYTSIAHCMDDISGSHCTLCPQYGVVYCPSINVSINKCPSYSGMLSYPFVRSNSVTCSLSYSTFTDNNSSQHGCIWCNNDGAKYEIKCCNVLRNTQVSTSNGIVYTKGNLMIVDSCILENKANYILYAYSTYIITLSNCTVDTTLKYGSVVTQRTVTKSFINTLNHMSTQNCHSEYNSAGDLTKKSFCYYNTCKNQYQARIGDFFSLIKIFLVAFIHTNPSGDCWYDFKRFYD
jgi:hypothetical protein